MKTNLKKMYPSPILKTLIILLLVAFSYSIWKMASKPDKKLNMAINGCYWGYFADKMAASEFATITNKYPSIRGMFVSFADDTGLLFPKTYHKELLQMKRDRMIVFFTWEPWDASKPKINILSDILRGHYDRLIDAWAYEIKSLKIPFLIRWGHEMDGNWYPWSQDPILYQQAYRYIEDRFNHHGVKNAYWMFAPNHNDGGSGRNFKDYFPGNAYVQCVGASGYNFGTSQTWSFWRSFSTIYLPRVKELNKTYGLPIFLDVGSAEIGGDKAAWIQEMMTLLKTDPDFQKVKGFAWFQYNKETDWRIESSKTSRQMFQSEIQSDYFVSTPSFTSK